VHELRDEYGNGVEDHDGDDGDNVEDQGVTGQQSMSTPRAPHIHREPKLIPLSPEDDIEHYLITFERRASVCRWPKEEWAIQLVPLLTGKARSAYVLMDISDSEVYDKVKEVILKKYEITADTYRRRFRSLDINHSETPRELYVRLKDLFIKWIKTETSTVKDISELLILKQLLRMVNPELEVWIRERDPKSAEDAARLAEVFLSARSGSKRISFGRDSYFTERGKSNGGEKSGQSQVRPHFRARQFSPSRLASKKSFSSARQDTRYYKCNAIDHTQYT